MVLSYVNETTLVRIINYMPNKNSSGEFSLSNAPSKNLLFSITPVPTTLFNDLIEKCFFPECLKHAMVVRFHKGGDTENPLNVRPISLLPVVSKKHKKILSEQICSFLGKKQAFERKHQLYKPCLV